MRKNHSRNPLAALLDRADIRRVRQDDGVFYSTEDVVEALTGSAHAAELWLDLKRREPRLSDLCTRMELPARGAASDGQPPDGQPPDGQPPAGELADVANVEGVLRLVQSLTSPQAERLKQWLAESGRQRLDELDNPELALVRTRKEYEREGHSRQWIDKRLRGTSARQELTSEWARRGASESDQYRALTNALMVGAFGMDVETYRRHKGLTRPTLNLRDHMTDMELVLTMLAETTAALLHREHGSKGYPALEADAMDAGEIVARTRHEIERRGGRPVVYPQPVPARPSRPGTAVPPPEPSAEHRGAEVTSSESQKDNPEDAGDARSENREQPTAETAHAG